MGVSVPVTNNVCNCHTCFSGISSLGSISVYFYTLCPVCYSVLEVYETIYCAAIVVP
jgi:hypothetical protein